VLPAYTEAINLLNYSAVVIPVTKADSTIDVLDKSYTPQNDLDKRNWEACKSALSSLTVLIIVEYGTAINEYR
jgi:hypothetical protein